jgi:hypothetical protein
LFALKKYAESAATIHSVLAVGPGWDWKTLSGLYPDVDTYTVQLRALEAADDKHAKAADIHFLLGYHYLTCGFPDNAREEFRTASKLRPDDSVAASLAATLSPRDAEPSGAPPGSVPKAISSSDIAGNWTAPGNGKATYNMNLQEDGTFIWSFIRGARKKEAKGVYTVEGNILAMEPDTGGVFLAELNAKQPDTLHFKMIGAAQNDAGLEFRR